MQQSSFIERWISKILIVIITLFAFTSTGNVTEYVHLYHKGWTGTTLGLTFGVTVFTCAYIAATGKSKVTRITAILLGSIFGLASAFFQMQIYMTGGASSKIAATLSFIPIMAGEVGLAILEHFYSRDAIAHSSVNAQLNVHLNTEPVQIERSVAPVLNVQRSEIEQRNERSKSSNSPVIEPRTEREIEFWGMLSEDVQYKITALAKQWEIAPNTLRNWKTRWETAQSLNVQLNTNGD